MPRTGAQYIVEYVVRAGTPYAVGIPGHGSYQFTDALYDHQDQVKVIPVMHEQSAVHVADAYYRVSGVPLVTFTSIGPGATNTMIGMATAFVDSSAVLLLTGGPHSYMRGHSIMQELDRNHWADFPRLAEGVTKKHWEITSVEQIPFVMHRAYNAMLSGRPGPVHVEVALDAQANPTEAELPDVCGRWATGRLHADPADTEKAAKLLVSAERPAIVAGGGAVLAGACAELVALAEHLGAPVLTTFNGKGAIPEDHPLNGWYVGSMGSTSGNKIASTADVLVSVGCRFVDWSSGSYKKGETYSIPPTKLIQIDVDPAEIGKNYPAEVGLVGDAKAALGDLLAAVQGRTPKRDYQQGAYHAEVRRHQAEWNEIQGKLRYSDSLPMTQQRAMTELRRALDRRTIITAGAGMTQMVVRQDFPVYEPRTHVSSGGFSTMGFTVPAAIGAKLAQPDRTVVGVAGDGDFLQTMQELAVPVMLDLPILFVVMNNCGWLSIRNGQDGQFGRNIASEFRRRDGSWYTPHFANIAREFGLHAERVEHPDQIGPAVTKAQATGGPSLVEVMIVREGPEATYTIPNWWDAPVPAYRTEQRAEYLAARRGIQFL
jgi:acetolactate synthase-1/2/3 large subunit